MKSKLFSIGLIIGCATILSGCASLNSKFDCPMKPGVMCESLDQVNTQVDQGVLGGSTTSACKNCVSTEKELINNKSYYGEPYSKFAINPNEPMRYDETVMRIWMAPFEDKVGNYYQPTMLYTVVKPGHWIGQPVKAISEEGDRT